MGAGLHARPGTLALAAALAALLPASGCTIEPRAGPSSTDEPETVDGAYTAAAMSDHLARQLDILGDKMVDLARAMPGESWTWAPMEGVRSVDRVYAHVAADNFFVPALLGRPVEGTGVTSDGATVGAYEDARGSREEIIRDLEISFRAMEAALAEERETLDRSVDLRGTQLTAGELWVRAITHLHEHLGQAIAYARANEVVPPWSR